MASFIFKPQPSGNANRQYGVEESRLGRGIPRKVQLTAAQMTTVGVGRPRNWPYGTDTKAPLLPGGK